MKKSLMVAAAVATLSLGAAVPFVAGQANAESGTGSSSLVDKIASKFNLNKDDVQKVFTENREVHQAEHEQVFKDKLATAVKDGKITQAQADKITAKHAEMQANMEENRDAMKDKTQAERKAAMEAKRAELETWAKDNGIDLSYLMPGQESGGKGPGGHRGMMKEAN